MNQWDIAVAGMIDPAGMIGGPVSPGGLLCLIVGAALAIWFYLWMGVKN